MPNSALKVTKNGDAPRDISELNERTAVKPINVWPMLMLLIVVLLLVFWLGGAFR
jgi:hypothetical protein